MTDQEHIRIFDSQGEDYKQAFQIFLNHTDQKRNAKRRLQQVVDDLPVRQVFVDAGAGNGELTRAFTAAFDRTIAIEPNAYLLNQLQQTVPTAEAIGLPILSAQPSAPGDLVLSSHTFYYIPPMNGSPTSNASFPGCPRPASPSSSYSIARAAA